VLGRVGGTGEHVFYSLRSQPSYVLLAVSAACELDPLLDRLFYFGLSLEAAARVAPQVTK